MTTQDTERIFDQLSNTTCTARRGEFVALAVHYAGIRVDWLLSDSATRRKSDAARTRAHNALIDACDALSRDMAAVGEDTRWRDELGTDRRVVGDLGCYIHYRLGLMAR